ncbi:MAG: Lrp/AsnC ligand binding domain-containing protein [Bacteroides sp.]|nr:Lrp/AsnC ligand binding domain-containing protein [Bacteroides sp.]MCM1413653.1 Lrp/AsnC ligand binding domain-containing protein [Bacteroides sp.]MCM1471832.1 Lrp/AsnC ligand binding domain-containing protein [Bacteroides sp.]
MSKVQFDTLDRKILSMLSSNGRKPFLEIARECNISGAAVHQRVQKLIQNGVVKGFEPLIDPASVGYETCAYIGFLLSDAAKADAVAQAIREIPEVVEVHYTTGKYDLLVKLYARNNQHLLQIIHDRLTTLNAGRTETLISFKEDFRRQIPINIDL